MTLLRRTVLALSIAACSVGVAGPGGAEPKEKPPAPAPTPGEDANRLVPAAASDDLSARAARLFEAIVKDEPALADEFFFPREPFLALKDVAEPGRYFDQLLATFHREIHALHGKRRSWEGAAFRSFELGSPPKWVKPGDEWNKIGYHRTKDGKLTYEIGGRKRTLLVRTLISWDGRWYVTHLLPIPR